jgi:hypothetical protein
MTSRRLTIALTILTAAVVAASAPASLVDDWRRGGFYLFSRSFFDDLPRRITGPGRFRFILQPLIASILGFRSGREDAREGRPPFVSGLVFRSDQRRLLLATAFRTTVNLILVAILLDSLFQWMLIGTSHLGAALVVGPVLIAVPYAVVRTLTNLRRTSRKEQNPS